MNACRRILRKSIEDLINHWEADGMPGRDRLIEQAQALKEAGCPGLWASAPTMITATIDDGIGQGIDLIGRFAEAVGVRVEFLGLMQSPERIVQEARKQDADLAGVTVLQLDTEPVLSHIARQLPQETKLIAGGPAFSLDPELADRAGVSFVARDAAAFLRFLLGYAPDRQRPQGSA
ncbi:MAG: cobalamin-dependent protein [Desulfobacterales bacterium]|nr:cobalamin-dependent protein [Desulfobacterales bacterium]